MLNQRQAEAVDLAKSGHNMFVNGPAGTGKTYAIKEIHRQLASIGKTVAITCTTGIACANFENAMTLHRWSGIHDGRYNSEDVVNILSSNEVVKDRIKSTDVLIIDEISMLSKKLFEQLLCIVTELRDNYRFLGGLQLIVSGDFFQLAPVPNKRYNDSGEFCFKSSTFKKLHRVTLTEVQRQKDELLKRVISKVSHGGPIDHETSQYIKSLDRPLKNSQESRKLFATNDLVNGYNRARIEIHPGNIKEYVSQDTGETKYLHELTAPKKLWLKEQCPVVLIRNLSDRLYNGLQGYVSGFSAEGPQVYFPSLKSTSTIGKVTFSVFSPNKNRVLASREQIPLLLAYALTVHKAQGMTLDSVEVDCQQLFRPGQLGVAMGRVRSSEGLRVINFTPKVCLPQPDEIHDYLTTPTIEPVDDCSCCMDMRRDPGETVDTFWFGDEMEHDVPVTEDDLEDDFNDVLASLDFGDTDELQKLPCGFNLENIIKECFTEIPVTPVQEQVNFMTESILSKNMRYCKTFCLKQFKEISDIMNNLEATPDSQIKAEKMTEVYSEIHKHQISDNYRLSCLLMFEQYPNFSGAHSYICTKLTDAVRKFIIHETVKVYDEKDRDIHERVITDASKARIRYVAGYCVSTLHKQYTTSYRSNMFSASSVNQLNYFDAKEKLSILVSMKEEEQYLKMFSSDKESLTDVDRRQYMTRGLVNVSDDTFEFVMKLCSKCLELLVDKNLNAHGQSIYQYCHDILIQSEELLENFVSAVTTNLIRGNLQTVVECSDELIVREVLCSTVNKVHNIHLVFGDLKNKFLMVMFNQFRKDLLQSFSVTKTMAHRKQILVRQQRKQTIQKSISFNTIVEDKCENKEMSHSLLRGLIMSKVSVLEQMKKNEIAKLGKAYGVTGKQNAKKAVLIEIIEKSILESSSMPGYKVFDTVLSAPQETMPSTSSDEQLHQENVSSDPMPLIPSQESVASSSDDAEVCGSCKQLGKEGVQWIQCSTCSVWYHRNCAGLRPKKEWVKYQDENVDFFCKQCR